MGGVIAMEFEVFISVRQLLLIFLGKLVASSSYGKL